MNEPRWDAGYQASWWPWASKTALTPVRLACTAGRPVSDGPDRGQGGVLLLGPAALERRGVRLVHQQLRALVGLGPRHVGEG